MIKGITWVRPARNAAELARLENFFLALGFESGQGWSDDKSRGAPFLAPLGALEFVHGQMPAGPEMLVEVRGLEEVRAVAEAWARGHGEGATVGAIVETHWNSRVFPAEPVPGLVIGFWEPSNPLHGRPAAIEGDLSALGMRFAVVVARWNAVITERLLQGSLDALLRSGARRADVTVIRVPGAWEVPAAARTVAETGKVDAIVTLGVLLRGETAHYEAIYNEVARGIGQSQQQTGVPHAFGVLTCETLQQALDRAGLKAGNKGFEAAAAAIEMVAVKKKIVTMADTDGMVTGR